MKILSDSIRPETFDVPKKNIRLFQLRNRNGIEVLLTNYGLRLLSLHTPDKDGQLADIILGYDTLQEYQSKNPFQNTIVGRYANRIANGKFSINNTTFEVDKNLGPHCLHGGKQGLHEQIWEVKKKTAQSLEFYHYSKAGTEGFPGNLEIHIYVTLTDDNELKIKYKVETDTVTPVNLTYHPYFNLSGTADILNHELQINADKITKTNQELIPTGGFLPVQNTPFDFREFKKIGQEINSPFEAIKNCGGYDLNFVLNRGVSPTPFLAATLKDFGSRRKMELWTTQPGLQIYTSNGVDEVGKNGKSYGNHSAICLESQHFPDAPNHPHFPTTLLSPNEVYAHECNFKFGIC